MLAQDRRQYQSAVPDGLGTGRHRAGCGRRPARCHGCVRRRHFRGEDSMGMPMLWRRRSTAEARAEPPDAIMQALLLEGPG